MYLYEVEFIGLQTVSIVRNLQYMHLYIIYCLVIPLTIRVIQQSSYVLLWFFDGHKENVSSITWGKMAEPSAQFMVPINSPDNVDESRQRLLSCLS